MNLANKLTLLRVFMIPLFLVVLYQVPSPYNKWLGTALFILAALTDLLDGYIARSRQLVTNFGKFMDPLADKLLVAAALIYFVESGAIAAWLVIVIISREFVISGFRLVAATNGKVIAASIWGKVKTMTTMVMIPVLLLDFPGRIMDSLEVVLVYLSALFTLYSAIDYVLKNKGVFHE